MTYPCPSTLLILLYTVFSFSLLSTVHSAKDNDYYYPNFVNPNTKYHMYWKDSVNVLQDLDQFESLYIKYHHCVWSKYGSLYGSGEDYDEQDDDNDEVFDNGCRGFGGGEYFWYMGRTQCFRANVAYSLYGVLKGDSAKKHHGSYCHGDSFINSFFTTLGVESFAGPMGLGTSTANSYCLSTQVSQSQNDFSYAMVDDDYLGDDYEFQDAQTYVSQGTGCSAKGQFVMDSYKGPFCHGKDYDSTLDEMVDFNAALAEMDCTLIYSASSGNNNNNNQGGRRLNSGDGDYDFDYEFEYMNAVQILTFSKTCSVSQYPLDCPDPFGLKHKYSENIQRALAYKTGRYRDLSTHAVQVTSWVFFAFGVLLLAGSYYSSLMDPKKPSKAGKQQQRVAPRGGRSPRKKKRKGDRDDDESTKMERSIEGKLSNLSDGSKGSSKASSKKSALSRLGLKKIKLPKMRFGGRGASDEDFDERGVEIPYDEATDLSGDDESRGSDYQRYTEHESKDKNETNATNTNEGVDMSDIGYITMDKLFDRASSSLKDVTASFSNDKSGTEVDELVIPRVITKESISDWSMPPILEDDGSTVSGRSNGAPGASLADAKNSLPMIPLKLRAIVPGTAAWKEKKAKAQHEKKLQEDASKTPEPTTGTESSNHGSSPSSGARSPSRARRLLESRIVSSLPKSPLASEAYSPSLWSRTKITVNSDTSAPESGAEEAKATPIANQDDSASQAANLSTSRSKSDKEAEEPRITSDAASIASISPAVAAAVASSALAAALFGDHNDEEEAPVEVTKNGLFTEVSAGTPIEQPKVEDVNQHGKVGFLQAANLQGGTVIKAKQLHDSLEEAPVEVSMIGPVTMVSVGASIEQSNADHGDRHGKGGFLRVASLQRGNFIKATGKHKEEEASIEASTKAPDTDGSAGTSIEQSTGDDVQEHPKTGLLQAASLQRDVFIKAKELRKVKQLEYKNKKAEQVEGTAGTSMEQSKECDVEEHQKAGLLQAINLQRDVFTKAKELRKFKQVEFKNKKAEQVEGAAGTSMEQSKGGDVEEHQKAGLLQAVNLQLDVFTKAKELRKFKQLEYKNKKAEQVEGTAGTSMEQSSRGDVEEHQKAGLLQAVNLQRDAFTKAKELRKIKQLEYKNKKAEQVDSTAGTSIEQNKGDDVEEHQKAGLLQAAKIQSEAFIIKAKELRKIKQLLTKSKRVEQGAEAQKETTEPPQNEEVMMEKSVPEAKVQPSHEKGFFVAETSVEAAPKDESMWGAVKEALFQYSSPPDNPPPKQDVVDPFDKTKPYAGKPVELEYKVFSEEEEEEDDDGQQFAEATKKKGLFRRKEKMQNPKSPTFSGSTPKSPTLSSLFTRSAGALSPSQIATGPSVPGPQSTVSPRQETPKSPLSGLLKKTLKTLSPSQMATAPPLPPPPPLPMTPTPKSPLSFFQKTGKSSSDTPAASVPLPNLVTPDENNKSQAKPTAGAMRFFPKSFTRKSADPATTGCEESAEALDEEPLLEAKYTTFDLTKMIDIIEPTVPPESHKDLYSPNPPRSQKSLGSF